MTIYTARHIDRLGGTTPGVDAAGGDELTAGVSPGARTEQGSQRRRQDGTRDTVIGSVPSVQRRRLPVAMVPAAKGMLVLSI